MVQKRPTTHGGIISAGDVRGQRIPTEGAVAVALGIGIERERSVGSIVDASGVAQSAAAPIAVLLSPVFARSAPAPTAVLKLPVVSLLSEK